MRTGLRHADSSDKLKGMMMMLQKKRTLRQINAQAESVSDLDVSQKPGTLEASISPAPAPHIPASPSEEVRSVSPEPTDSATAPAAVATPDSSSVAASSSASPAGLPELVLPHSGVAALGMTPPASPLANSARPASPSIQDSHSVNSPLELCVTFSTTAVSLIPLSRSLTLSARRLSSKIILPAAGYRVEAGRSDINWPTTEVPVEAVVDYYRRFFYEAERSSWHKHWNFIGFMDQDRTDPCIISVADTVDNKMHRVIIRTAAGSHQIYVPANKIHAGAKHVRDSVGSVVLLVGTLARR